MARWMIHLSYWAKNDAGDVLLTHDLIHEDTFSSHLFVLMVDPLIKTI